MLPLVSCNVYQPTGVIFISQCCQFKNITIKINIAGYIKYNKKGKDFQVNMRGWTELLQRRVVSQKKLARYVV
jgi:hypothetical protein